jgi:hypothetical protein
MTDAYDDYIKTQTTRIDLFFGKLGSVSIHPSLKFTIMRLCGGPLLKFACCVTPPRYSTQFAEHFERCAHGFLNDMVDGDVDRAILHDRFGAGVPDYPSNCATMYNETWTAVKNGLREMPRFDLITTPDESQVERRCQHEAHYLFYNPTTTKNILPPHLFTVALALRLNVIPKGMKITPLRCACQRGEVCATPSDFISHVFRCDHATNFGHYSRHNLVRDAMANVARRYGMTVMVEPDIYKSYYPTTSNKTKPDITFNAFPSIGIATDVTIVSPDPTAELGTAARKAAVKKQKDHHEAVERAGHKFIPAAFECFGHFDDKVITLVNELAATLPACMRYGFSFEFKHAVSTALAAGRAHALYSAASKGQAFRP